MRTFATRLKDARLLVAVIAALAIGTAIPAQAAVQVFWTALSGPAESPPNASPAVGAGEVDFDIVAHTMRVRVSFVGLIGTVSACHIHAPTAVAGTGTAGVATTTPTFAGFPSGVTFGEYDNTLNMTLNTSFNAPFITNNGGTVATAEAALLNYISAGRAYVNVHSSSFPGGEIRGFLQAIDPTPTSSTSWGRIKQLYR